MELEQKLAYAQITHFWSKNQRKQQPDSYVFGKNTRDPWDENKFNPLSYFLFEILGK